MTEPLHTSPDAKTERLRLRYAKERRFKLYGQIAIAIAIGFLAILLISIGSKAASAFSRYMLVVEIDQPDFTTQSDVSVTDVNLAVRDQLQVLFPGTLTDRAARADLFALTTRLSVLPLTRQIQANPELANQPLTAQLAVSDDLDLYLKNDIRSHRRLEIGTTGRLSRTEAGLYRLTTADPDGFFEFQDRLVAENEPATDIIIEASGWWFVLEDLSGATLILSHAAGAIPDLGEQDQSPISAILLGSLSADRKVTNRQIAMALYLKERQLIEKRFNASLFTNADSTYPELAGAAAAIIGSLFTMLVTAIFAIPVGILAAVYLEEFAKKSLLTSVIEVNINNLAAVPSIIFGLLGAAVFLNTFDLPRSVPLVGGLVLGLLVLPTIIIASRAALRSIPPSVRDAALGLGASPTQAVFHHVLPLAAPGILTGAIIAMARALGETAPLLLIGMVAFISEVPASPNDESTVLPVLIYKWFSGAERAWEPMTSAVIIILLIVLVSMNLVAVLLRRRFERKW
ncbi:MAG: phosphate ABC transporter permease PstA [Pseudomonadota bacterium]